ncbi:MAG: hypothetical protein Q9217_006646 [Psora testacea]
MLSLPLLSSTQVLQILLLSAVKATPTSIWHVSIFQDPAPPPGKGPPVQASALRDESYLPAQIASIIASYVLSVLLIGTAILFVGRRLRRAAQASPKTLSMEMMKPANTDTTAAFDPSPVSPRKNNPYGASPDSTIDMRNNWPSPNRSLRGSSGWGSIQRGHKKQPSESQASVVTFDESVIEDDKVRNEREMERLYAAVMEHDEKRSTLGSKVDLAGQAQPRHPPELQHLRDVSQPSDPSRADIKSPAKPITRSPEISSRPTPISVHSRNSSRSSFGSFGRKRGVRGLHISPPMGSPGLAPDYDDGYGDTESLKPRLYPDPGPPPLTPDEQKALRHRQEQKDNTRPSPNDTRFPITSLRKGSNVTLPPGVQTHTIPEVSSGSELQTWNNDRLKASKKKTPAPLALRTQAAAGATAQHHPLGVTPLPLRNAHPTNYNADRPEPSPTIKATVLERKISGHSLRSPMTGVPMTPYSPYMPKTPLTPMTPSRLVTREERRRREKEEGRRVPTIEDAVEEEADMWGDAYH